jgi:hypothetical protein
LQHCRQAAVILESLKEREIDREGNPIFLLTRFFLLNSFTDLGSFRSIVLVKDLETARKVLSTEQSAQLKAEQILQQSKDVNAALSLKLDNIETSLAITQNKFDQKSKALKTVEADLKAKRVAAGIDSTSFGQARRVRQHDDFFSCGPYCSSVQESFAGFKYENSAPGLHCG